MSATIHQVEATLNQIILGKPQQIKLALTCLLAEGHLLLEDLPGMGKTTLAHALAECVGLNYRRVQFTSDLLPADLTGFNIYDARSQQFSFHEGPLFSHLLLADEINRASPKTQSALLEAMEEHQVTVDGATRKLPEPFFVIATQNPLFHSGTNALPESQLDRFLFRLSLGFPDRASELQLLQQEHTGRDKQKAPNLLSIPALQAIQAQIPRQQVSPELLNYVVDLIHHSRNRNDMLPLSPRAAKGLLKAAKAYAFLMHRDYVTVDDVRAVFPAVAEHRIQPRQQMQHSRLSEQLLQDTPCLV